MAAPLLSIKKTRLGFVRIHLRENTLGCLVNLATTHVLKVEAQPQEPQCLDKQLRSFWELESLGVQEEKTLYDELTAV